jgi:hypothetical protein
MVLRRAIASGWMLRGTNGKSQDSWDRKFNEPITLPAGRRLVILRDAAQYIQKLPKKEEPLLWEPSR